MSFTFTPSAGFDAGVRLGEFVHEDMISVALTPPTRFLLMGSAGVHRPPGRSIDGSSSAGENNAR